MSLLVGANDAMIRSAFQISMSMVLANVGCGGRETTPIQKDGSNISGATSGVAADASIEPEANGMGFTCINGTVPCGRVCCPGCS